MHTILSTTQLPHITHNPAYSYNGLINQNVLSISVPIVEVSQLFLAYNTVATKPTEYHQANRENQIPTTIILGTKSQKIGI